MPNPTAHLHKTLVALCLANVLAAVASYFLLSLTISAGHAVIVSRYRGLDLNGVINQEALQEFDDGKFAGAWTRVPDDLGMHAFKFVKILSFGIPAVFVVNAWVLGAIARGARLQEIDED